MQNQVIEAPRTEAAKGEPNGIKRFFKILGPGLITGASDDDPSGIATYSQAGAAFGYGPLWTAIFTLPMTATIQYLCAKIGLVQGQGLATVLRQKYPRWVLVSTLMILVVANTINAGADIGAVAAAIKLLIPQADTNFAVVCVTAAVVIVLIMGSYRRIVQICKWLTLSLLAYLGTALFVHADWYAVVHSTFIPQFQMSKEFISIFVAILGTTISPYLFFWQTDQEVEEQKDQGLSVGDRKGASQDDLKYASIDVNVGILFSNLVMYFIIFSTAATLHAHGTHSIDSATQAASALEPLAGKWAKYLFAAGIIGTGLLAIPVLVGSSAFAISESFGWRRGLNNNWRRAKQFYGIIIAGTVLGGALNFLHVNVMQALVWSAILNGILAPPLLTLIMLISGSKEVMGDKVNSRLTSILGWGTTIAMYLAAAALLWTSIAK